MRLRASDREFAGKPKPSALSLEALRAELDGYYENMVDFRNQDPRDILLTLSGYRARASQIRTHLLRNEERGPMQLFRTKELDPFRDECEFQFKVWSRLISAAQVEWEMTRGHA